MEKKFISKAGREIFIKMLAQAIPKCSTSLFKLPRSICDNINSLLAKYWWGQNQYERKILWINRKKLCTQKKDKGMGFRDLHTFNLAMLSKQPWRLIQDTHSMFYKVYKARYFPNCSFITAAIESNPSFFGEASLELGIFSIQDPFGGLGMVEQLGCLLINGSHIPQCL